MLRIETFTSPGASIMQLILDKITPSSLTDHLERPRLLAKLRESLETCTCTVISGRAGSGKTTLAADFAESCGRAVAWYKVDAPDADLRIFFEYLLASIRQQKPGFKGDSLQPLLDSGDPDDVTRIADAFIFELLQAELPNLLVVIEDLHLVCDAPWVVPFFRRSLPLLPRNVHAVITSRTLPPAPLWRMRSKQSLAVIDEAELGFTRPEVIELFARYGLSKEQAGIALDHTHGRASALTSCVKSLRFSGTDCSKNVLLAGTGQL